MDEARKKAEEAYGATHKPIIDYSSVGNMAIEQKLAFLKDPHIDPKKLADPRDDFEATMYHITQSWQNYRNTFKRDPSQSDEDVRHNEWNLQKLYYSEYMRAHDRVKAASVVPAMKVPIEFGQFSRNLDDISKTWNMDANYRHDLVYGLQADVAEGISKMMTIAKTVGLFGTMYGRDVMYHGAATDWKDFHREVVSTGSRPKGYWETVQEETDKGLPGYKQVRQALERQGDRFEAYNMIRPYTNKYNYLGAAVGTALQWEAGPSPIIKAFGESTLGGFLPKVAYSIAGKGVRGALAEGFVKGAPVGALYGILTRKIDEKDKYWQDALTYGLFESVLTGASTLLGGPIKYYGGKFFKGKGGSGGGGGGGGGGPTVMPPGYTPGRNVTPAPGQIMPGGERLPSSVPLDGEYLHDEADPTVQDRIRKQISFQRKLLTDGREPAGPEREELASQVGTAETIYQHGGGSIRLINDQAAEHMISMEPFSPEEIGKHEVALYENGTEADRDMLDAVARIRSTVGQKALSTLSKDERSTVLAQLDAHIQSTSNNLLRLMPDIQKALKRRITSLPNSSIDLSLVQHLVPAIMQKLGPHATPDQIAEAVKAQLGETLVKAHMHADKVVSADPVSKAIQTETSRKGYLKTTPKPVSWLEPGRYSGKIQTSPTKYTFSPSWRLYARNALSKAGKKWTTENINEHVDGLSYNDFATDIHAFFIPKFLKDMELKFETGQGISGPDHSNLFAFAWNFKDQMPEPYARRLETEIQNSPDTKGFFDDVHGNKALSHTEKAETITSLIRTKAMKSWNHVDNFLNSGHFPKELALFRQTGSHGGDPEIFQGYILKDRELYENRMVKGMFPKGSDEQEAALNTLKVLHQDRREAVAEGSHQKAKVLSALIKQRVKTKFKKKNTITGLFEKKIVHKVNLPSHLKYDQATIDRNKKFRSEFNEAKQLRDKYAMLREHYGNKLHAMAPDDPERKTVARLSVMAANNAVQQSQKVVQLIHDNADIAHLPPAVSRGPAGWVDVDKRTGNTTLYLNALHMHELMRAAGDPNASVTLGISMSSRPDLIHSVVETVKKDSQMDPAVKEALIDLVVKAGKHSGPEGIIATRTGEDIRVLLGTIHEERTHGWQRLLGVLAGSKEVRETLDHLDPIQFAAMNAFMPKGMRRYLSEVGYEPSIETFVIESTAKLIYDDPLKYDVTENEALTYIWEYFNQVIQKHGSDALDRLTTARDAVEEIRRHIIDILKPGEYQREGSSVLSSQRIEYPAPKQQSGLPEVTGGP